MLRQDLTWPISIIITMVSVIALLILAPSETPSAAPLQQSCGYSGYPTCTPVSGQSTATATTNGNTNTPTSSSTIGTPSVTSTGASATPTTTATGSTATATLQATATRSVATLPTTTPLDNAIACLPDSTVFVEGNGPSYTAILIYFADKAVGGGTTNGVGHFKIPMKIGREKYGVYEVQARIRNSQRVVAKKTCIVPYFSPTSTPSRRSPP